MPHGIRAGAFEEVLNKLVDLDAMKVGEELGKFPMRGGVVGGFLSGIKFDPVARRQHHSLGPRKPRPQFAVGLRQAIGRKGQPLTQAQISSLMVAVDDLQNHDNNDGCKGRTERPGPAAFRGGKRISLPRQLDNVAGLACSSRFEHSNARNPRDLLVSTEATTNRAKTHNGHTITPSNPFEPTDERRGT